LLKLKISHLHKLRSRYTTLIEELDLYILSQNKESEYLDRYSETTPTEIVELIYNNQVFGSEFMSII